MRSQAPHGSVGEMQLVAVDEGDDCMILTDLHGLDGVEGILDALDLDELGGVRQEQLVHDLELAFARPDGGKGWHGGNDFLQAA
ncbi:hypothetical protein NUW54_g14625 [Trametes sanguinea]|uniref:Uncharacterized protein n=1 Tax=Trametes sanguinea TaxID=158606 RepID=A0ACC1MB47_9APHY|nr:hypothetical protein NUW54_g14625 [Trametes sanguinea]